jgi:hypothetical protein
MDVLAYSKLLNENLISSAKYLGMEDDFVFMQDNDTEHKSRLLEAFFEKKF